MISRRGIEWRGCCSEEMFDGGLCCAWRHVHGLIEAYKNVQKLSLKG